MYENKNEINSIFKDMGRNLPIYHAVSLSVWGSIICPAIIPENVPANSFFSSLDSVSWYSWC